MSSSDLRSADSIPKTVPRTDSVIGLNTNAELNRSESSALHSACADGVPRVRTRSAPEPPASSHTAELRLTGIAVSSNLSDRISSGQSEKSKADVFEIAIGSADGISRDTGPSQPVEGDSAVIPHQPSKIRSTITLVIYSAGILVSYIAFGIFQQKILQSSYGPKKERFNYPFTIVFIQCSVSSLLARILLATVWKQGKDQTSCGYYVSTSFFYMLGMLTSTVAFKYVSYPTQVVAKSSKPIPVMLIGVLLASKRYSLLKYCFVTLIVTGIALFFYEDTKDTKKGSLFGNVLLGISLISDGLVAAFEDRMRQAFQTKSLHLMSKLNFFSVVYVVLAIIYTGELPLFFSFLERYPHLYGELALFSACSVVGHIFIYSIVAEFGPLVCSIVTTTRKFFTILGSVLLFGDTLSAQQWIGAAFVFTGLILDASYGRSSRSPGTA